MSSMWSRADTIGRSGIKVFPACSQVYFNTSSYRAMAKRRFTGPRCSPFTCKWRVAGHRGSGVHSKCHGQPAPIHRGPARAAGMARMAMARQLALHSSLIFYFTKPSYMGIITRQACVRRRNGAAYAKPVTVRPPLHQEEHSTLKRTKCQFEAGVKP
jgi:hypothetical protein